MQAGCGLSDLLDTPDEETFAARGAGAEDRIRFQKARDYMIRLDDMVSCSKCRKRIEITSKSVVLL